MKRLLSISVISWAFLPTVAIIVGFCFGEWVGKTEGFQQGVNSGQVAGWASGQKTGYRVGYTNGFTKMKSDIKRKVDEISVRSFEDGKRSANMMNDLSQRIFEPSQTSRVHRIQSDESVGLSTNLVQQNSFFDEVRSRLNAEEDKWKSIKEGMSRDNIRQLLGSPEMIAIYSFNKNVEVEKWRYYGNGSVAFGSNGLVNFWIMP